MIMKKIALPNKLYYIGILVFSLLISSSKSNAQGGNNITNDIEFWSGANVKYDLSKKFRIDLEEQLRLDNNITQFKTVFTQLGVRYRLHRYIRIGTAYRFIIRSNEIRHRISGDIIFRYRKKKFPLRVNYRIRLQKTFQNNTSRNYLRNKLRVGYNATRLVDPYIAGELYYRIYNMPNEFQKYRLFSWIYLVRLSIQQRWMNVVKPYTLLE